MPKRPQSGEVMSRSSRRKPTARMISKMEIFAGQFPVLIGLPEGTSSKRAKGHASEYVDFKKLVAEDDRLEQRVAKTWLFRRDEAVKALQTTANDVNIEFVEFVAKEKVKSAAPRKQSGKSQLPKGDIVFLGKDDFDALADLANMNLALAAYDAVQHEEMVPSDVINRILDGENPVRVWREHRGMRLSELADQTKISRSHLSEVERGRSNFSIQALRSIARTLKVDMEMLLPDQPDAA